MQIHYVCDKFKSFVYSQSPVAGGNDEHTSQAPVNRVPTRLGKKIASTISKVNLPCQFLKSLPTLSWERLDSTEKLRVIRIGFYDAISS